MILTKQVLIGLGILVGAVLCFLAGRYTSSREGFQTATPAAPAAAAAAAVPAPSLVDTTVKGDPLNCKIFKSVETTLANNKRKAMTENNPYLLELASTGLKNIQDQYVTMGCPAILGIGVEAV